MRPSYFYQIEFKDGRVIRREYQTKTMAKAVYESMVHEMLLFNVNSISYGKMQ